MTLSISRVSERLAARLSSIRLSEELTEDSAPMVFDVTAAMAAQAYRDLCSARTHEVQDGPGR